MAAALLAAFALSVARADALPPGADVRIDLRPRIDPPHDTVTLGDMADLTTRDPALLQLLMALPIGSAPGLGRATVVDRASVRDWVMLRTGWARSAGPAIAWGGAAESLIESPTQLVTGDRIAAAAREALTQWLAQRSTRARADVASPVRDLVLPRGEVTLRVRPPAADAAPTSRMQVWVEAWVRDAFIRSSAVSFAVEAWGSARMTTAPLAQGTSLSAAIENGRVVRREVDLARLGRRDLAPGTVAGPSGLGPLSDDDAQLRRPLRRAAAAGHPAAPG
ncbi:MAG: flagella basal body P-ring formation protein FlgA, partial [Bordetella sp.]|nr:flagella basal body P-ring formation protein FlgA [Bordetella sp.]